ncbi:hypothetical protein B0H10DRAFT_1948258 [Mycena sp. CBHHK59/15]|nr:hypothetical protein B0H10DRAFT_1948258 [Mycena sp. CBHHK59/15]
MSSLQRPHDSEQAATAQPVYWRNLSQNELSYFLPSRAYGLNDMYARFVFRASPALVSPLRLRLAWAIMRLRHTLLACQIEMKPGCYDDARFKYTPPASPSSALYEAGDTLNIYDDKTGLGLIQDFLSGPRKLSSERVARVDVARERIAPNVVEYHMLVMMVHAVNDGISVYRHGDAILELVGGPAVPGGPPRTDVELAQLLDLEWRMRCSQPRADDVIVPPTEARLPLPWTAIQDAAWKIDHQNVQRRYIGGHTLPRIASAVSDQIIDHVALTVQDTAAVLAQCKKQRVTVQNAMFALCNFAWIRTAHTHPEFAAPKPLRAHLAPTSALAASYMSLALGYCNIVLPAFLPAAADPHAIFWLRARAVQAQMRDTPRARCSWRARRWTTRRTGRCRPAQIDRDARAETARGQRRPVCCAHGISQMGDLGDVVNPARYTAIQFLDCWGHVRKGKGGIILFTHTLQKRFSMSFGWDRAAFPPGVIEEFWGYFQSGVHEFIIGRSLCRL